MVRRFCCLFPLLLFLLALPAWGTDDTTLWDEALAKIETGDLTQATTLLNQLLSEYPASPKAPGAQLKLAYIKYKTAPKSTQELLDAFSLVRSKYGSSLEAGEALVRIGYLHGRKNDTALAIEDYKTFLRDYPTHPLGAITQRALGSLYLRILDLDKAEAAYDAVGTAAGAKPDLAQRASMQSGFVKIMKYYATKDKANLTNAINALTALDSATNPDIRAQSRLGVCESTLLLGKPLEAYEKYQAAVEICSSPYLHGIAMYGVAFSSEEAGLFEQAVTEYDALLASQQGATLAEKDQNWRQIALKTQSLGFQARANPDWSLVPGAGIFCTSSSPTIEHNVIESNTIQDSSGEGGGIFANAGSCPLISANKFLGNDGKDHGGGIALETSTTRPVIVNNLFVGNHAAGKGGGAINALQAVPQIINNTFAGNYADPGNGWPGNGGAILLRSTSDVKIFNNVFYDNDAEGRGESVYADEDCGSQRIEFCDAYCPGGSNDPAIHYTHWTGSIYMLIGGVDAASCQYVDPLFVDTVDYRLRLTPSASPCIDKGVNPGSAPYDQVPAKDFDGYGRPVDITGVGNDGGNALCDMGSYELQQ